MTRVRFDLETIGPDRRLHVQTASVDVTPGSHFGRLSLSVEGLVIVSVPMSPLWDRFAEPDDDDDQDDDDTCACGAGPREGCPPDCPDRAELRARAAEFDRQAIAAMRERREQLYDAEERHRGRCGHISPRTDDGVEFTCEKPIGHDRMHAALNGRMGW